MEEHRRAVRGGGPERLLGRAVFGSMTPREAAALREGLSRTPVILDAAARCRAPLLAEVAAVDPLTAVIILITVPLIPVFMMLIGNYSDRATRARWHTILRLGDALVETLRGLLTLEVYRTGEGRLDRIRKLSDEYRKQTMATLRIAFLSAFALELVATMSTAVIAVAVGLRVVNGDLDFELHSVGIDAGLDVGDLRHRLSLLDRPPLANVNRRQQTRLGGRHVDFFRYFQQHRRDLHGVAAFGRTGQARNNHGDKQSGRRRHFSSSRSSGSRADWPSLAGFVDAA